MRAFENRGVSNFQIPAFSNFQITPQHYASPHQTPISIAGGSINNSMDFYVSISPAILHISAVKFPGAKSFGVRVITSNSK
jgi:hypothetical protein